MRRAVSWRLTFLCLCCTACDVQLPREPRSVNDAPLAPVASSDAPTPPAETPELVTAPPHPADPKPASDVRDVLLQAFYWNVPKEPSWWSQLSATAGALGSAGFGAVWIPPPYKGASGVNDVGYGVYDRYDLGEFKQKGTIRTRYGTRAELEAAIAAFHAANVRVYADIVMNHMLGADATETVSINGNNAQVWSRFDFAGRANTYSAFAWNKSRFNGCDTNGWKQWSPWDFAPYYGGDAWDNLLGCEIRYSDASVRAELIAWGKWITETLQLDGYRLDATKHMSNAFVNEWLDQVKGERFTVSEAWLGNLDNLKNYASLTQGRTHLFDVPLHYLFSDMSAQNGGFDMKKLQNAGFTAASPALSVTFVDNHDTVREGGLYSPVERFKLLAYAYILLREGGVPSVFLPDYETNKEAIEQLIALRYSHARGAGVELLANKDLYVYARLGTETGGLVLLLNDGQDFAGSITTPFKDAILTDAVSGAKVTTDENGNALLGVKAASHAVYLLAR